MDMKDAVPQEVLDAAIERVLVALKDRIKDKSDRPYRSRHETYGIIAEEFNDELMRAMRKNDGKNFEEELVDIAVAAIFGLASHITIYK